MKYICTFVLLNILFHFFETQCEHCNQIDHQPFVTAIVLFTFYWVIYLLFLFFIFIYLFFCLDGLIGLGVLGGAAAVGGAIAVGAVALIGLGIAKATK